MSGAVRLCGCSAHARTGSVTCSQRMETLVDDLLRFTRVVEPQGFVPTDTQWINTRCSARSDRTCQSCFSAHWRGFTSRQLCRSSIGFRSMSGDLKSPVKRNQAPLRSPAARRQWHRIGALPEDRGRLRWLDLGRVRAGRHGSRFYLTMPHASRPDAAVDRSARA